MKAREFQARLSNLGQDDASFIGGLLTVCTITNGAPSCSYYWENPSSTYGEDENVEELHLTSGEVESMEVDGYIYIINPDAPQGVQYRQ